MDNRSRDGSGCLNGIAPATPPPSFQSIGGSGLPPDSPLASDNDWKPVQFVPTPPPRAAEELMAVCTRKRGMVLAGIREGRSGVSVESAETFAKFVKGQLPHAFPLPPLRPLWDGMIALDVGNVPPWQGEPTDSSACMAALDSVSDWCRSKIAPSGAAAVKITDTEANVLVRDCIQRREAAGKKVTTREVAKSCGIALGRVSKLPAWQAYQAGKNAPAPARQPKKARRLTKQMLANIKGGDDPSETLASHEEIAWRYLQENAKTPEERARLNGLTPAEKAELIELTRQQLEEGAEENIAAEDAAEENQQRRRRA